MCSFVRRPAVILNALAGHVTGCFLALLCAGELLAQAQQPAPRSFELARFGVKADGVTLDTAGIQADRPAALERLLALTGAMVVLKGAGTLVGGGPGGTWLNTTGNPGMAAPGMGDVLCGFIAALLVQGLAPEAAAVVGVWLHGAAGDTAVQGGHGPVGLAASELIPQARRLLNQYLVAA